MRNFLLGLSIAGAFIAGSLFSGGSPQSADAQQGVQRWEYHCTEGYNAPTIMERANAAGADSIAHTILGELKAEDKGAKG